MKINKLAVFVCCLSVAAIASADLEERVSALENQASLQALENKFSLVDMVNFNTTRKRTENHMVIIIVLYYMLVISSMIQFV